jgi:uncharacterized protein (DUF1330 family)
MAIYPSPEQIEALLAGPKDVPVVMLNLLRFRERADAPDEGMSGEAAYHLYAERMVRLVESIGGRVLWSGRVDSFVIGDTAERFDAIALVEYPSRQKFVEIAQSPAVAEIAPHRAAGLEMQWLVASTERPFAKRAG